MNVKIFRICKDNPLPKQGNNGDAGWDVYASEDTLFDRSDQIRLIPLGIIAQAPKGYHFKLCIRSSVAYKLGFTQPNAPGIIDHSFCGENDEIRMILESPSSNKIANMSSFFPIVIKKGTRIGQLLLEKNHDIEWVEQEDRNFVSLSRGGFGSTGA